MRQHTIEVEDLTITMREEIGRDVFSTRVVYRKLLKKTDETQNGASDSDDVTQEMMIAFASMVCQTETIEGDLGFTLPDANAAAPVLRTAFEQWQTLSPAILVAWTRGIRDVNTPPGDPDLFPPEDMDEKKEVAPTS